MSWAVIIEAIGIWGLFAIMLYTLNIVVPGGLFYDFDYEMDEAEWRRFNVE